MPAWGLHNYPFFEFVDYDCTQTLQSAHLSFNVIGLDIDMYSARVIDPLQQDLYHLVDFRL